jgi:CubicO group peptidase (beta-lactamase class C family)
MTIKRVVTVAALVLLSHAPNAADAQGRPPATLAEAADRIFAAYNSTASPGCAVGVRQKGVTLLERAYGMADLNGARALTPATILESGSVAKQFLAMSAALLVADGKLRLDDDARTVLPELPLYDAPITFRHLLTHTSGIREWSNLVAYQGWPRGTRRHTQDDVFRIVTSQKALNYPVGAYYSYTNSGFLLMRTVIERVSGQSFEAFTQSRLFAPLGMANTSWRGDYTRVVPGLAQAYSRAGAGWRLDMPFDDVIGAGGLYTTVGDWLIWNDALTKRTLGAQPTDMLTQQMRLSSGHTIQYALGLTVTRWRNTQEISHSGSTAGYSTFLARYPSLDNLSIAVMCNVAGAPATALTHQLVDYLAPPPPPVALDSVTVPAAQLGRYVGEFENMRSHAAAAVTLTNGVLRLDATPLVPLRDGRFAAGASRVRIETAPDGNPRVMYQSTPDGDSVRFEFRSAIPWTPTAAELAAYVGRYTNTEVGGTFTVRTEKDALVVELRPGMVYTLAPMWRDAFDSPSASVWFTRDARGRVNAMHFGADRVWDLVSTRVGVPTR